MRLSLINKVALTVCFLSCFTGTSHGQETFLKLDSLVIKKQTLNITENSDYFIGLDSTMINLGPSQYLKIRSVTWVAKVTNYPVNSGSSSNVMKSLSQLFDASVSLGDVVLFTQEDFQQIDHQNTQLGKSRIYPDLIIPPDYFNGTPYLISRFWHYDYGDSHNEKYEIFVELVYYSLE